MPHPIFQTNLPLTVSRRFTVNDAMQVTVVNVSEPFRGRIYPPTDADDVAAANGPPRGNLSPFVLWYKPGQAVGEVVAGDRLYDGVDTWEVVRTVHGKRAGLTVLINECLVQKVDRLYPSIAQLRELGSAVVIGDIPIAVWDSAENDTTRGTYLAVAAEAPVEHYGALSITNRELVLASRVMRVDDVILHTGQPHVSLTLREGVRV